MKLIILWTSGRSIIVYGFTQTGSNSKTKDLTRSLFLTHMKFVIKKCIQHIDKLDKLTIYLFLISSQLLSIKKKVSLVFHFLFIFMLQIFRGQADPLISD